MSPQPLKIVLIVLLLLTLQVRGKAQELNCLVTINDSQVLSSDRSVFKDMKRAIEQFINGRKWTNDTYQSHEKINCNIRITITQMPSIGSFSASVQIQSARPIYNTSYSSLLINFADRDWDFEYIESLPLEYNDNTYTSNLTSMLAFYAYIILGYDYDTFSELGGTPYFQKAMAVLNNAQSSNRPGWQQTGSIRNRYWYINALINPQLEPIRKSLYSYHRLGLDTYHESPDQSRQVILGGLKSIKSVRDINPNSILLISFIDAKSQEIANIFSEGDIQVRRQAYDLITTIDPTNNSIYGRMIEN